MNPLAATKCAGRLLMALTAIASTLLIASCGSSSSAPTPNIGGFNNGSLNGTYVLSVSGTDFRSGGGSFFAIVGTIKADGKGNITGGTVDINDANLPSPGVFQETLSATTYSITSDGRGTSKLLTSVGDFGLDFVLTSTGHGLVTRFDIAGTGSGTLDLQGSASQSSLGSLAFSLAGADSGGNSMGTVGAFTLNPSTGAIASGTQDFNDNGSSAASGLTGLPFTGGSLVLASGGTTGTAVLTTSSIFGSLGFDVWVVKTSDGSTHLKFIETDTTGPALSGDAFTQQTSFTAGQLVFTISGADFLGGPFAAGGYVTTTGDGSLSNGIEDFNDDGTAELGRQFTGGCAGATLTAGRCQLNLIGFTNASFAAYPSSGGVLLLENDSNALALSQGAAFAQSEKSFAAPAGYGLNLSGVNANPIFGVSGAEVDDIAQFITSTATTNNMVGVLNENDLTIPCSTPTSGCYTLLGTYIPDPTRIGSGSIVASTPGSLIGGLSLEYYVVDGSTMLFVEGDSSQVAIGTFEAQSVSGSGGAAQSRMAIVHPLVRPHAALRSK
ncbi:MAG TPA: hypothetical protein VK302_15610 [Terriglobales bacterium]|nr:hypothetical protein [Terriglobales bacterium]